MTEQRLIKHWFGGPQVPFWNFDPQQFTLGVEIEYFIAKGDESDFRLATQDDYLTVARYLRSTYGYKEHNLQDQPGRISKDTTTGFVAIKPDFAWHILEISLPPRKNLQAIAKLFDTVISEVDDALKAASLKRMQFSALPEAPQKMELVALARMTDFSRSVRQKDNSNPFVDPLFPAYVTATHVHLNAFNQNALSLWPHLYATETATGEIYCRAKQFGSKSVASVRTEFLNQTMGQAYKLKGIPDQIPQSISEYVAAMNASTHAFPKDPFFPVRDVSYIRPSRYGTVEFRSACSAGSADNIIEICAWRMTQMLAAYIAQRDAVVVETAINQALAQLVRSAVVPEYIAENIRAKAWPSARRPA